MKEKLLIHAVNEAYSFAPEQVVCIEADGNYSNLYLTNGNSYLLSFQLGQVESIIKEQLSYSSYSFVRVGKSLIVNVDEVLCVNITKQTLEMSTTSGEKLLLSASREALKKLMAFMVENRKNGIVRSINIRSTSSSKGMALLRGHHQAAMPDDDIRVICNA
ncbi:MAG: LytTR family transcriptional regulator [Bacteroidaceae bacterium]|jgi:DNA-binding LytR/AlgR family response regulator|nr:LytTR family transcriptional regulator [Bacteroidaceae bacterium]